MAIPAEIQPQISQFNQFADFIQQINDSQISDIVESITYNVQSQTYIIQMRDLLRRGSDELEERHSTLRSPITGVAARKLAELSRKYQESFPEFERNFSNWKPCREELIKESETCADKLERNSMLVSGFRILTSTADLCGTVMRLNETKSSWAESVMEYASGFGFASLFLEKALSVRLHKKIRSLVERDQDLFEPMKIWFQQTEELDSAVQNFFPYGIDERLVLNIHKSSSISDEYNKIFMSVIASNAKSDPKLFTNRDFLERADMFSTSEAGIHWYHKILTKSDPIYLECLKSDLGQEINQIAHSLTGNLELCSNSSFLLTSKIKTKIILNGLSILMAASNILDGAKTDESEGLRKLAKKTQKELEAMETILNLMRPNERRS